jgi:hypothetical protein
MGCLSVGYQQALGWLWVAVFLFRLTINWEIIIVIPWKRRAEVIEIIWERVEPRAA